MYVNYVTNSIHCTRKDILLQFSSKLEYSQKLNQPQCLHEICYVNNKKLYNIMSTSIVILLEKHYHYHSS